MGDKEKDALKKLCEAFDGTPEQFAKIVTFALASVDAIDIANYCECIPSSIIRWADGSSKPLPGMQKVVIEYLSRLSA